MTCTNLIKETQADFSFTVLVDNRLLIADARSHAKYRISFWQNSNFTIAKGLHVVTVFMKSLAIEQTNMFLYKKIKLNLHKIKCIHVTSYR